MMLSLTQDKSTLAILQTGRVRLRLKVKGIVQGIGFRPYVYKLSRARNLDGFVMNTTWGVLMELEGSSKQVVDLVRQLEQSPPLNCDIWEMDSEIVSPRNESGFSIVPSSSQHGQVTPALPDLAICDECRAEISDPGNRRYRYPFTSCIRCGPRYSIITRLPYDRSSTAMAEFTMCQQCQAEYDDPDDRRFHAEANACPDCGPILSLLSKEGEETVTGNLALTSITEFIRSGKIVAMKGLGGFQLLADARNESVVRKLRNRKQREFKPFAVMFKSLDDLEQACYVSVNERQLLSGRERPIVILRRRPGWSGIADAIAPGNPYIGVMLPYTPLHYILMQYLQFPVVATSGNISQDPIITENNTAVIELGNIADAFLVHNRNIVRPLDDSVVQEVCGSEQVLRLARGYAPLSVKAVNIDAGLVAMGGHVKTALAATGLDRVVLGLLYVVQG
ncbi:MAG: carbamoyltransferase HypF, partial [Gammaproteobacteria bacterium]|nr:carbamoyltransferase HypF [Gammaproteobacteria bacterium]